MVLKAKQIKRKNELPPFAKLLHVLIKDGKKARAEVMFYRLFYLLKTITHKNPIKIINKSLERLRPLLAIKLRKIAGRVFYLPTKITRSKSNYLAAKWLIISAVETYHKRKLSLVSKLSFELLKILHHRNNKAFLLRRRHFSLLHDCLPFSNYIRRQHRKSKKFKKKSKSFKFMFRKNWKYLFYQRRKRTGKTWKQLRETKVKTWETI